MNEELQTRRDELEEHVKSWTSELEMLGKNYVAEPKKEMKKSRCKVSRLQKGELVESVQLLTKEGEISPKNQRNHSQTRKPQKKRSLRIKSWCQERRFENLRLLHVA